MKVVPRSARRKLIGISSAAALTVGLVLGQGVISPASAAQQVADGGFEATVDGDSPSWTEADSEFDTPLCDVSCGFDFAHTGDWWAWFGGSDVAGHTGSISQSVTIPAGTHALSYYYYFPGGEAPFDATLTVKVDGTTVKTHHEVLDAAADYVQVLANITPFADGAAHTLSFNYLNGAAGLTAMMVDDVSIDTTLDPATTGTPTVTAVTPAGPSNSATPKVTGTAEAGSTVTLYASSTCDGAPLGSGTAAEFAGAGITATVPTDATTTIFAQASKATQFDSACSASSVSYTNDATTPDTTITSSPAGGVAKSLTVSFGFTSSEAGSSFTCKLDTGAAAPCTSPRSITVTPGKHTFSVAATDSVSNTDATPATVTFTAYDCASLDAALKAAQAKSDAAAKKVTKAKKALKKAKKSGDAKKIAKAKKKAKKAKKAAKAAKAALSSAQAAAAPCGGTTMKSAARK